MTIPSHVHTFPVDTVDYFGEPHSENADHVPKVCEETLRGKAAFECEPCYPASFTCANNENSDDSCKAPHEESKDRAKNSLPHDVASEANYRRYEKATHIFLDVCISSLSVLAKIVHGCRGEELMPMAVVPCLAGTFVC